ncbi:MAG: TldD/PmbA family protein [Herpetosiphon sp.]
MQQPLLPHSTVLLERLLAVAVDNEVSLIARLQQVERRAVQVTNGRIEGMAATQSQGLGLHVFDAAGHTAFATTDRLDIEAGERALRTALTGLRAAADAGVTTNTALSTVAPARATVASAAPYDLADRDLSDVAATLQAINTEIRGWGADLKVSSSFVTDRETWRIVRSDGTDVQYVLPHGYCSNTITYTADRTSTAGSALARTGYEVLWDERPTLLARAANAARLAVDVASAPRYPAGTYPLVLDYAMAKGLAHEAFGHAAETDGLRTSILATDGRLRRGEQVADEQVSIIDEPVACDHAYQPWSPNGLPRGRATIVDHGVLRDGLADLFSAAAGGVPVGDAARAQSYRNVPVPRMTNIRIELPGAFPITGSFESQTPQSVRHALLQAGLLRAGHPVIFLTGYRGGQVNPATGDFVFNCTALYELTVEGVALYQPAIFSGQSLAALRAIRAAWGPLQLDAMGFCGKAGQSVPSSGGSHYFVYLDEHPAVRIGGA